MPGERNIEAFSRKVGSKLGYYVYLYIDPRDGEPFYIGKGKGNRCFAHLADTSDSEKTARVEELRRLGLRPRIDILKYGLTEREALLVESTAIDLVNVQKLTNRVRGHGSRHAPRATVEELEARFGSDPVDVEVPALLIVIRQMFRPGMAVHEVYDATRSAWKIGTRRDGAEYAMAVHNGIVREVFRVTGWHPSGTTMLAREPTGRPEQREGRWEFVGIVAEDPVRRRYVNRSVAHYFKAGAQNPIMYVNC